MDRGIDDFVERVLDIAQPVGLNEIYTNVNYTNVNILAEKSRTNRKSLAQIQEIVELDLENFKRFSFGEISQERVASLEGVKEHRKLMIWGKPGQVQ